MLACVDVVACPGGCTLASIDSKDVRFGLEAHLEAHVAAQDDVCSHFYKPSGPTSTPGKKTRPWRCYYCEKSGAFESVANLVRHIYSKHVREPPPLIPSPRSPAKPPTKEERKARQETKRQAAKAVRPTVGLGSFFRALVSREERRRRREDKARRGLGAASLHQHVLRLCTWNVEQLSSRRQNLRGSEPKLQNMTRTLLDVCTASRHVIVALQEVYDAAIVQTLADRLSVACARDKLGISWKVRVESCDTIQ